MTERERIQKKIDDESEEISQCYKCKKYKKNKFYNYVFDNGVLERIGICKECCNNYHQNFRW